MLTISFHKIENNVVFDIWAILGIIGTYMIKKEREKNLNVYHIMLFMHWLARSMQKHFLHGLTLKLNNVCKDHRSSGLKSLKIQYQHRAFSLLYPSDMASLSKTAKNIQFDLQKTDMVEKAKHDIVSEGVTSI